MERGKKKYFIHCERCKRPQPKETLFEKELFLACQIGNLGK
jgi:hypothetical protein